MQQHSPLYLSSQSRTRKHLLSLAKIAFIELIHRADEKSCDWNLPAEQVVSCIARLKMDHTLVPYSGKQDTAYVLTVDTVCTDTTGTLYGKPANEDEARSMIALWRNGCKVITGFCLDKKQYQSGTWITQERIEQTVSSKLHIIVPEQWIDSLLKETSPLESAGGVAIEEYGCQFVQSIEGSYTNILGLPLFEVRTALETLGFFSAY